MAGVVLVDDQPDVVALMQAIVEVRGTTVEVVGIATGGAEAIDVVGRVRPDLVVIDHHMPLMTGIAAARTMLQRQPGVRIILCSAYLDEEVCRQAREAGICACLSKDRMIELGDRLEVLAAA